MAGKLFGSLWQSQAWVGKLTLGVGVGRTGRMGRTGRTGRTERSGMTGRVLVWIPIYSIDGARLKSSDSGKTSIDQYRPVIFCSDKASNACDDVVELSDFEV